MVDNHLMVSGYLNADRSLYHSGGGIAGLCLAHGLLQFPNIEVAIYEAAQSLKEIGAGIMIWGRAWQVLSLLGLDKAYRELAGAPPDGSSGILSN
jgi:salicylate hydroxylase